MKVERLIRIISLKNQAVISEKCHVAECFWNRLKGLIGKSTWSPGEGMLFPECRSIHMWFMRVPIEVVFLNEGRVTSLWRNVKPWRLVPVVDFRARDVLELPPGTIDRSKLEVGDRVECLSLP